MNEQSKGRSGRRAAWIATLRQPPTPLVMVIAFASWLTVFAVGMSVPSQPLRDIVVGSVFEVAVGQRDYKLRVQEFEANLTRYIASKAGEPTEPDGPTESQKGHAATIEENGVAKARLPDDPAILPVAATHSLVQDQPPAAQPDPQAVDATRERETSLDEMAGILARTLASTDPEDPEHQTARSMLQSLHTPPSEDMARPQAPKLVLGGWGLLWMVVLIPLIMLTATPTNLVLLCVSGALIGASCIRMVPKISNRSGRDDPKSGGQEAGQKETAQTDTSDDEPTVPGEVPIVTAILNGLSVYLAIAAGLIVIQGELTFDTQAPNLYIRLASAATLFSIVAGTNRFFVYDLITTVTPFGTPKHNPQ